MKSSNGPRATSRTCGMRRLTVLGAAVAVLVTGACGSDDATPAKAPTTSATTSPTVATPAGIADDQYLSNPADFVDAANWDAAEKVRVELTEMSFTPKDLKLEAGKPYVIELANVGAVKHEFTAGGFFRAAATRKAESKSSEVKAAFFTEVEVLAGKTVELLLVPVVPGTYVSFCEIAGHREAGMEGTVTVSGSAPTVPAPVLTKLTDGPWVQNGPALVEAAAETWDAKAQTVKVEAREEGAKMLFAPKQISLKVGTPVVLELKNAGKIKHEFTSAKFFPTVALRKAEDADGEYKSLLLKEAEVFAGKELSLFLIPTRAGTYELVCEIEGHREAGMVGKITVKA